VLGAANNLYVPDIIPDPDHPGHVAAAAGATSGMYTSGTTLTTLIPTTVSNVGGSQPHENRQPFLTVAYLIALQGIFPQPDTPSPGGSTQPFIGEIQIFAGNFAPAGWAFCDGAPLAISENDVLFTLIGTTYGGDGQNTFNVPNLSGRFPIHMGTGPGLAPYQIGETGGTEAITLTPQSIPIHNHAFVVATDSATGNTPRGNLLGDSPSMQLYRGDPTDTNLWNQSVGPSGGSQPHSNLQPYVVVNYIISLFGIYPS
jgi:microcystin-dependent protein